MRIFQFLFSLIVSTGCFSCKPATIIGHWARLKNEVQIVNPSAAKNQAGDLILSKDSTFLIIGDKSRDTSYSSGWHLGEELTGRWTLLSKKHLWLPHVDVGR